MTLLQRKRQQLKSTVEGIQLRKTLKTGTQPFENTTHSHGLPQKSSHP